ncbi:MAG: HD domain-containing protein [Lachnospiraceae bacterium]|nr:HD domain-containing protein [Lachnospiraceae bacterium]
MDERLKKQIDFIIETDKAKQIFRQNYIADGSRKENDAEHGWQLALMSYLLKEHANEDIDIVKVMIMVLIHDIVEIDAGDTYAFDEKGYESKRDREVAAADRIYNILPKDQAKELYDIWEEFEAYETPEAKYAHALDHFQPLLLHHNTNGISWKEHGISKSQVYKRNIRTKEGSKTIDDCINEVVEINVKKGNLKDE